MTVDLDRPIPQEFIGKVGFNLEFFPGSLFGKPWIMDGQSGIFPQQPNSPLMTNPSPTICIQENYHDGPKKSLADMDKLIGKKVTARLWQTTSSANLMQRNQVHLPAR